MYFTLVIYVLFFKRQNRLVHFRTQRSGSTPKRVLRFPESLYSRHAFHFVRP